MHMLADCQRRNSENARQAVRSMSTVELAQI